MCQSGDINLTAKDTLMVLPPSPFSEFKATNAGQRPTPTIIAQYAQRSWIPALFFHHKPCFPTVFLLFHKSLCFSQHPSSPSNYSLNSCSLPMALLCLYFPELKTVYKDNIAQYIYNIEHNHK